MSAIPAPIEGIITGVASVIITVLGLVFWFDIILLLVHFIEYRIHPTPGGRASALGDFVGRVKGMLIGYAGLYLAIILIVTVLNQAFGASISASQLIQLFLIKPITNALSVITGG